MVCYGFDLLYLRSSRRAVGPALRAFECFTPPDTSPGKCEVTPMRKKASPIKARAPTPVKIEPAPELQYWTEKLGCTERQLQKAVSKVGSNFEVVRAELARKVPLQLPESRMKVPFAKSQAEQIWHKKNN